MLYIMLYDSHAHLPATIHTFFPLLRVFSPWLYMKEQEFTSIEPFKVIDSIDFLALTTAKFCHSMVIGLYHYD
mgnify:FL=1|jgi:hypothetical protein